MKHISKKMIINECFFPYLFKRGLRDQIHLLFVWIFSRLLSRSIVHFIGDSHVVAYKKGRFFVSHHIGPATAYRLASLSSTTNSNKKLFTELKKINKQRDIVVLVFGEVDCRMHINKQFVKQNGSISIMELITRTIYKYGEVLAQVDKAGYLFFVHGIVPAATQGNIWGNPYYGDSKTRLTINSEFNKQLKTYCAKNGYPYLDIQSKFADESGFISPFFSNDGLHLNQKVVPIMEKWLNVRAGSKGKLPNNRQICN